MITVEIPSKEGAEFHPEEGTVHVSTIVVFLSRRGQRPGYAQEAGVEGYAVRIAGVWCRCLTPTKDLTTGAPLLSWANSTQVSYAQLRCVR